MSFLYFSFLNDITFDITNTFLALNSIYERKKVFRVFKGKLR